jgi:hypothetical protein
MARLPCPYLKGEVELTEERERHIRQRHPDLLPEWSEQMALTLADPDNVRRSSRMANARIFSRWFDNIKGGTYAVVVVVSEMTGRHWVITAYQTRRLEEGAIEWKRS